MTAPVRHALEFLASQVTATGSLPSYSSPHIASFHQAKEYPTLFPAALAVNCLAPVDSPLANKVRQQLATFVLSQKSEQWSFNYWQRDSAISQRQPYPDDLDDTSCALAALTHYDASLIDGTAMAQIVSLLTLVEHHEGGPYRTWLVPPQAPSHWHDVDLVVNCNVAYFLGLHDIELPNLTTYLGAALEAEQLESPYYPSVYPVAYFLSRCYQGPETASLRRLLTGPKTTQASQLPPLNAALVATTLLRLKSPVREVEELVSGLVASQAADGSWPAYGFCLDPAVNGTTYYAGSAALTTAFCLEAISLFEQATGPTTATTTAQHPPKQSTAALDAVKADLAQALHQLPAALRDSADRVVQQTLAHDDDNEIALLPYYTKQALAAEHQTISDQLISQLGAINVLGWSAYTLYDDVLDDEGKQTQLPVATACSGLVWRLATELAPEQPAALHIAHRLFIAMDEANHWEARQCHNPHQLPDYGDLAQLADKSSGHLLGPLVLLLAAGFDQASQEYTLTEQALRHYLIARQLDDDAHDWQADLRRGHINAVAAALLKDYAQPVDVTNEAALEQLNAYFWQHTIETIIRCQQDHLQQARRQLDSLACFATTKPITHFFESTERSITRTQTERQQTLQFITAYSSSPSSRKLK